jgi:hypothetical protein
MGFTYAVHQNENNEKFWKLEQSFGNSLPTYLKWEDFFEFTKWSFHKSTNLLSGEDRNSRA